MSKRDRLNLVTIEYNFPLSTKIIFLGACKLKNVIQTGAIEIWWMRVEKMRVLKMIQTVDSIQQKALNCHKTLFVVY